MGRFENLRKQLILNSGWRDERFQCVTDPARLREAATAISTLEAEIAELVEGLAGIRLYANDTLSGRADGPADAAWYRAGIRELRNRARSLLSKHEEDRS